MALTHHSEDRELARRLAAGDDAAFEDFFDEYFPRVYRFARTRLQGNEALVEDVVQETLCDALRAIQGYRGEAALFSWLCTICRRLLARRESSERSRRDLLPLIEDSEEARGALESLRAEGFGAEREVLQAEARRRVHVALDAIPERYARCLEWKYLEGLRVDEIAWRMGVSAKAAESVLTRARLAFKDAFRALGGPLGPEARSVS